MTGIRRDHRRWYIPAPHPGCMPGWAADPVVFARFARSTTGYNPTSLRDGAEAKLGAWEFSVPAKAKPVIEQVKEGAEPANWLERAEFTGLGAAGMGLLWGFAHWRGRRMLVA